MRSAPGMTVAIGYGPTATEWRPIWMRSRSWVRSLSLAAPQSAGHVELGEGHRTNEALSVSRYQEELVLFIPRWRFNVGQQQHGWRASSMERPQREKFGPSHGVDGETVFSGRKDTLLPVHFVGQVKLPRASSAAAKVG